MYWKLQTDKFILRVSKSIKTLFKLYTDIITPYDNEPTNYFPLNPKELEDIEIAEEESYVCLIPTTSIVHKFIIKKANEEIKVTDLIDRFNTRVQFGGKQLATLENKDATNVVFRRMDSDYVVVVSKYFHIALNHRQAGLFNTDHHRWFSYQGGNKIAKEFSVSIYPSHAETFNGYIDYNIALEKK